MIKKTPAILALLILSACSEGQSATHDGQAPAVAGAPSVALAGRVTDAAEIIDSELEASISSRLKELETRTGHQMVVVTVPTLGGQEVADFTRNLGIAWGIGRRDHDDGVILLVAPNERKVRIAVGYGLEQRLPNALCEEILARDVLPRFREGDLAAGIDAGVNALVGRLL